MAWILAIAQPGTRLDDFLPGVRHRGVGIGGVFAPMATEAMRNVEPRLAGAASGVNNTMRQVGSVLGSAVVGALLQNRLAASLQDEATARAGAAAGAGARAVRRGLQGRRQGRPRGRRRAEAGAAAAPAAEHAARTSPPRSARSPSRSSTQGYVAAMKPTMALPIVDHPGRGRVVLPGQAPPRRPVAARRARPPVEASCPDVMVRMDPVVGAVVVEQRAATGIRPVDAEHLADDDAVVAAVVHGVRAAFEGGDGRVEDRRPGVRAPVARTSRPAAPRGHAPRVANHCEAPPRPRRGPRPPRSWRW